MNWKPVADWPYEVSDEGLVRSNSTGNILTPMWTGSKRRQYATVRLCRGGEYMDKKVHVLVLEAFVGSRPEGRLALHRDDDARNNSLPNLYWGSHSDNGRDRRGKGFIITQEIADEIRKRRAGGERGRALAAQYGLSEQAICDIVKGRKWA